MEAETEPRRHGPWLLLVFLAVGAAIVYGGFVTYADQRSGTPAVASVTECTGGRKYQPAIRCRGAWEHRGRTVLGDIENSGYGDVGERIEVRAHADGHATKPGIATSIVLWALGAPIVLLSLLALRGWWRARPAASNPGLPG